MAFYKVLLSIANYTFYESVCYMCQLKCLVNYIIKAARGNSFCEIYHFALNFEFMKTIAIFCKRIRSMAVSAVDL